jgi:hypothetical protein
MRATRQLEREKFYKRQDGGSITKGLVFAVASNPRPFVPFRMT